MEQPDGYAHIGKEHLVCKLQKSLYGLKQSPRCWNTQHFKNSWNRSISSRAQQTDVFMLELQM